MKASKWIWFAAFAVVWLGLRVFWLDGDAGIPSVWEYGYNVTDEGYYMGAAKDKFLWGAFNDLVRSESFTYGYSALTHWISYIGYRLFGLSDWKWRIPFVLIYFIGWCLAFRHAARRIGPVAAFCAAAAFACVPVTVIYERTAGNDVTIAALFVISYCLAVGTGHWRLVVPALVAGAIILIKPSLWVLLPLLLAGVWDGRKTSRWWLDAVIFLAALALSVWGWRGLQLLSVLPETAANGVSAAEIIRRTTTHNALPNLFDFAAIFRGFASFPRDPSFKLLSVEAAFMSAVPLAMVARAILLRRWTPRFLLYLFVPTYVAAISVNNSIYTHYFHPVMVFLPILWSEIIADLSEDADAAEGWRMPAVLLALTAAASALLVLWAGTQIVRPQEVQAYYSRIHNLPQGNVWAFDWPYVLAAGFAAFVLVGAFRGLRSLGREGVTAALVAAATGSVAFAGLPAVHLSTYFKSTQWSYLAPVALAFVVGMLFVLAVFGVRNGTFRRRFLAVFVPAAVILSFALTPQWRDSACEMFAPVRHVQRDVAQEVAKLLPEGAVVLGERSTQVLMGQPFRTVTTMPGCNPIPILERLVKRDPQVKLYGLFDSQNAYNIQHLQKNKDKYDLLLLRKFSMPSFVSAKPVDVFFCQVKVKDSRK